jgi:hypothetical protein
MFSKHDVMGKAVKSAKTVFHQLLFLVVPFDEDERDMDVWYLDHDYLENMYTMFKKVNG